MQSGALEQLSDANKTIDMCQAHVLPTSLVEGRSGIKFTSPYMSE
jgi:hypothetical protein